GANLVFGDSASLDYRQTVGTLLVASSIAPAVGGDDGITSRSGNDVVVGGTGADTIDAGNGDNVVVGDNGELVWNGPDGSDATLDTVTTTAPETGGGNDAITTGTGNDVIAGNDGADTIVYAGGDNVVHGERGRTTWFNGRLDLLTAS